MIVRTEKILLKKNKLLDEMLNSSARIYNKSLYFLRQEFFKTKAEGKIKTPSYHELYRLVKETEVFENSPLDFNIKQKAIKQASNAWKSFIMATIAYNKDSSKFSGRPSIPKYLKYGKLNILEIDKTRFSKKTKENIIKFYRCKLEFVIPPYIEKKNIRCLRIVPFYDKFKLEIAYWKEEKQVPLNKNNFIGIDIGLNNLMAITSNNQNLSAIINGRPLKSINQYFNKKKAHLQSKLEEGKYSSKRLKILSRKRQLKIDNYIHWASKEVINLCLGNDIRKHSYWKKWSDGKQT